MPNLNDEITDEVIVAFVRGAYGPAFATSVEFALGDERSPFFASHVRRSFIREMKEQEQEN